MTAYDLITDQILTALDAGTIPWRKPWATGSAGVPRNLVSGRPYRGINVLILSMSGYASPYWLTLRQANKLGGRVRKGEKSTVVVFWKWMNRETVDPATGETVVEKRAPLLRYYRVFNVEQCDGVVVPDAFAAPVRTVEPIDTADAIVAGMPQRPAIAHGGGQACYAPVLDQVRMPERATFTTAAGYYATLFHELGHSTGHASRLNRKGVSGAAQVPPFGSADYSAEELVAELTSAFLCGEAGIAPAVIDNAAAYIGGWLKALRDDRRMIVIAGAQAQKAADFVLGRLAEQQDTDTDEAAEA